MMSDGTIRNRPVTQIVAGMPTTDGAGVSLTRFIGTPELDMLDPFLLLDAFESDNPDDYIAGFPPHPHRGFETVTYMLAGQMRHEDSTGHGGVIGPGGVQWMTAGRGIVHSEMPEQVEGLLQGFQLWVNLPRATKMTEPRYREHPAEAIPIETRDGHVEVRADDGDRPGRRKELDHRNRRLLDRNHPAHVEERYLRRVVTSGQGGEDDQQARPLYDCGKTGETA